MQTISNGITELEYALRILQYIEGDDAEQAMYSVQTALDHFYEANRILREEAEVKLKANYAKFIAQWQEQTPDLTQTEQLTSYYQLKEQAAKPGCPWPFQWLLEAVETKQFAYARAILKFLHKCQPGLFSGSFVSQFIYKTNA